MDLDELKKLIRLFEKSNISEIEIEEDNKKVKLSKFSGAVPSPPVEYTLPAAAAAAAAAAAVQTGPAKSAPAPEAEEEDDGKYHKVKSPMVGTFYRSPSEDAEPFVNEGDIVNKGQTLCIIEAMKLMNEIESDQKGKIVKIVLENGSVAEYGQVLFKIEAM
jgi:acetyl-CoA carboxylase biotin carboxyl carrier protein